MIEMPKKKLKSFLKSIISRIKSEDTTIKVGTKNEAKRAIWLKDVLKKVPNGSRILDAGAGEQKFKNFCSHLKYVSQDFSKYDGKGDGKGLQTIERDNSNLDIVSDIINIPEPDNSFDAIMCIEVFEHLPEPILAIKEFSRLIKKKGYLILTAPFCSLTHYSPYHFYSGYNRYFYETHLARYGFQILEIEANGNYFEYIAQELRRVPEVSRRYTNSDLKLREKKAVDIILQMLDRFSKKDKNSHELLNFGYHVFAQKTK